MSDSFVQLYLLLSQTILPRLQEIQAAQEEQRLQSNRLDRSLAEFRAEMYLRFGELHSELASIRNQVEDALITLSDVEAAAPDSTSVRPTKKPLLN